MAQACDFKHYTHIMDSINYYYFEARRGAVAQSMTVNATGCGFDPMYISIFFALLSKQSALLSSVTQHVIPEFGGQWGTECLNTRFLLPTLLCAVYSANMI